jgi:hypothetical protein
MKEKGIYLVATYIMKPKDHVNTSKKGWKDDPNNIRWDEKVEITRGIKKRDGASANVILDLSNLHIDRNNFQTGRTFDEIFRYYFNNYNKYLIPIMGQLHPDYLDQMAKEIEQELSAIPTEDNITEAKYEELETK